MKQKLIKLLMPFDQDVRVAVARDLREVADVVERPSGVPNRLGSQKQKRRTIRQPRLVIRFGNADELRALAKCHAYDLQRLLRQAVEDLYLKLESDLEIDGTDALRMNTRQRTSHRREMQALYDITAPYRGCDDNFECRGDLKRPKPWVASRPKRRIPQESDF
jgi:hypothetical protein